MSGSAKEGVDEGLNGPADRADNQTEGGVWRQTLGSVFFCLLAVPEMRIAQARADCKYTPTAQVARVRQLA